MCSAGALLFCSNALSNDSVPAPPAEGARGDTAPHGAGTRESTEGPHSALTALAASRSRLRSARRRMSRCSLRL